MRAKYETVAFLQRLSLVGLLCAFAAAQARAQAVDLLGMGINADFETPDLPDGPAEANAARNLGSGWTYALLGGGSNDYGVQDPADGYYGAHPLPAPFNGRQIGYFNLEPLSAGEIVSKPVGAILAGQNYTLNVAVGARANDTWSNQRYSIGLRTTGGVDLGTFATVDLDPAVATIPNISDLQYALNVNSQAAAFVGQEVSIVVRGINLGTGVATPAFTQANFDNVRLTGTLTAANSPLITINRNSGAISLSKTGAANMNIAGYSLTSASGSFNSATWSSIANTYDKNSAPTPGNGSVDGDDAWTILSPAGSSTVLSEGELEAGGADGGNLSNASPINLGNVWRKTPFEDVQAQLSLTGGAVLNVQVQYTGTAIPSGDLTGDGMITGADWTAFKNGQGTNFTGLTDAEAYLKGDLDNDNDHDLADFIRFRAAYELAHPGAGSFEAMIASVPEPSACLIVLTAVLTGAAAIGRRLRGMLPLLFLAFAAAAVSVSPAQAQSTVAHWSFDSASLTTSGGNITGVADSTGNHNAVNTVATGGATGMALTSNAIPITNSTTGSFGQGLTLSGSNTVAGGGGQFLTYPKLAELMTANSAPGAPSYSVSYWIQTTTTNAHQFTVLGDWGNSATNPGRFTYGYGFQFTGGVAQMRGQSRHNTTGAGNGTDIFARAVSTGSLNDGSWHMLTWTFNTTTGALNSYFDGSVVDTFTSAATNFNMIDSSSPVGTFGVKGDSSNFINGTIALDEAWVFNGELAAEQVANLYNCNDLTGNSCPLTKLRATVNTTNGQVVIDNPLEAGVTFNSYLLGSAGSSLDSSGWNAISNQSISGFPAGDGSGNGWEPGSGPNPQQLAEYRLIGDSMFAPGASINLGNAYNEAVNSKDIVFRYSLDDGSIVNGHVFYVESPGVPGDYSQNGVVDAEDYTIWRDHLGQNFQLNNEGAGQTPGTVTVEDYNFWKANFGASGAGSASDAGPSAVPEPATGLLLVISGGFLMCVVSSPRTKFQAMCPARLMVMAVVGGIVVCGLGGAASAAYTVDRLYHFGDDPLEHGANGVVVGSASEAGANTLDTVGPSLAYIDLAPNGAAGFPTYIDVSATSADLAQVRPGAPAGNLGIRFDGVDDFLNGLQFGYPHNAPGTYRYTPSPGPNNYDGVVTLGFQVWVYPNSTGSTAAQHIVMNTRQHGLRTNAQGEWALVYNNNEIDSNVDINFNQWSHVMVAMPGTLPNREVLYVNGVAIAARQSNYTTNADPSAGEMQYALTVGANTSNAAATLGTTNRFNGVLDELEMFVWGSTYDAATNTVTDLGKFNYATDNEYAATHLTGVPGDVNQSGSFTQADVDDFVAGWLSENLVNNIRVGDTTSILDGDLNFDGVTDLQDMTLLRGAIGGAGSGSFDLTGLNALGVPEPTTLASFGTAIGLVILRRARRLGRPPK